MNDLARPSLYNSYHEVKSVDVIDRTITADIVGPICESSDFLAKDRVLPDVDRDGLYAVMSAGAYGMTMASNYNSRPRVPEILVDGDTYYIVRRREIYNDLTGPEMVPEYLRKKMNIPFYKMTGAGNDFIFIDNRDGKANGIDRQTLITKACARNVSVGADGLVLIENSDGDTDFKWRFYNCDGSEAEMCGNASRCAGRFAKLNGIAEDKMSFDTLAGVIEAEVKEGGVDVKVQLTPPFDKKIRLYAQPRQRRTPYIEYKHRRTSCCLVCRRHRGHRHYEIRKRYQIPRRFLSGRN